MQSKADAFEIAQAVGQLLIPDSRVEMIFKRALQISTLNHCKTILIPRREGGGMEEYLELARKHEPPGYRFVAESVGEYLVLELELKTAMDEMGHLVGQLERRCCSMSYLFIAFMNAITIGLLIYYVYISEAVVDEKALLWFCSFSFVGALFACCFDIDNHIIIETMKHELEVSKVIK